MKQALHLQDALQAFAKRTAQLPPDEFGRAWRTFTTSVQNCIGSTGIDPYVVDWQELLFPGSVMPETLEPRGLETPVSVGAVTTESVEVAGNA